MGDCISQMCALATMRTVDSNIYIYIYIFETASYARDHLLMMTGISQTLLTQNRPAFALLKCNTLHTADKLSRRSDQRTAIQ
ncbi:hypothetical protein I7I50_03186 [Histoplasma capsulatum G186AR]|uniref:Uncharacterized protein n=1 Tax=Ajellomyces capsulatus TaxID=5037 RepID=A0A8H8D5E7_AJECA|nr:hypothetical protein I7I52_00145 [Histoplasma capsulatum]QSS72120.1 hypothetical protein I7I50_03186 [Histoplasma capsulatum G186AR]